MRDHNHVSIIGRLAQNAEIRYTTSNLAVCQIRLAVTRTKKTGDGQYQDEGNFFNVSIFGEYARKMQPHLTQGKQILVDGELRQQSWQDENGKNRSAVTIVGNFLQFLRSPGDHTQNSQTSQGHQNRNSTPATPPPGNRQPSYPAPDPGYGYNDFEDDIPF